MAHGYYNLQGKFVTTATKEEATAAWRAERGYKPLGVFDMGGGKVVDTRKETVKSTPAANLAQTFAETDTERNARLQSAFDIAQTPATNSLVMATSGYGATPAMSKRAEIEARSGYALSDPARQRIEQRGGYDLYAPPKPAPTVFEKGFWIQPQGTQNVLGKVVGPLIGAAGGEKPKTEPKVEPAQYTGRQYYMGGSERAYLGLVAQAEEYFFGTGDRWGLGSSYIDIAPEDRKPPPILNQSTVRILTKSGPSYLDGVDYGPKMAMEDIERIYEYDPATGHYLLKGAAEPELGYGYPDYSGQGYAYAGPSQGYGYGSRGGQVGSGLINWRIGF